MSKKLPHKEFLWMEGCEIATLNPLNYSEISDYGMILEVDLSYPDHLFDLHKDQPLAPDTIEISEDMLPDHVIDIYKANGMKMVNQQRLAPNFYDKKKYILHIANLKFYLEQGLELTKIHRGIIFFQSSWLKPYIALNTRKRVAATSEFERSFFKLLINSVYGK